MQVYTNGNYIVVAASPEDAQTVCDEEMGESWREDDEDSYGLEFEEWKKDTLALTYEDHPNDGYDDEEIPEDAIELTKDGVWRVTLPVEAWASRGRGILCCREAS